MAKAEKEVVIVNKKGLHLKAASHIRKTASAFKAEIEVVRENLTADAKSILGLLGLQAAKGASLTIRARGEDAEEAVNALARLIENKFGETEEEEQS